MAGTQRHLERLAEVLTSDRYKPTSDLETYDVAQHFGGVSATGADLRALEQAKKQAESGTPMKKVWKNTGWYQAPWDQKWRTWLDHRDTDFSQPDSLKTFKTLDWGSNIYKNYPQIRATAPTALVSPEFGPYASGYYDPVDNKLSIEAGTQEVANSVGYHELQHKIGDIEGFANGTNRSDPVIMKAIESLKLHHPKEYIQLIQHYGSSVEEEIARKLYSLPGGVEEKIAHDLYSLNAGEAEARLAQLWMGLSPEEVRKRYPLDEMPAFPRTHTDITNMSTVPKVSVDFLWGDQDTAEKLADILLRYSSR